MKAGDLEFTAQSTGSPTGWRMSSWKLHRSLLLPESLSCLGVWTLCANRSLEREGPSESGQGLPEGFALFTSFNKQDRVFYLVLEHPESYLCSKTIHRHLVFRLVDTTVPTRSCLPFWYEILHHVSLGSCHLSSAFLAWSRKA